MVIFELLLKFNQVIDVQFQSKLIVSIIILLFALLLKLNRPFFIVTFPFHIKAIQSPVRVMFLVSVYVHELTTYIVLANNVHPLKLPVYTTLLGIQLESQSCVYAVSPVVPFPNSAYLILKSLGPCSQKSEVKNSHHHPQLAKVGVRIFDAPQSIPIIANAKIAKA